MSSLSFQIQLGKLLSLWTLAIYKTTTVSSNDDTFFLSGQTNIIIYLCIVFCTLTHGFVSCTPFHQHVCVCVCGGFHWLGVRNFRMKYLCAMCDHFQVELFNGDGWHLVYYMVWLVSLHELYILCIVYVYKCTHTHKYKYLHRIPKTRNDSIT